MLRTDATSSTYKTVCLHSVQMVFGSARHAAASQLAIRRACIVASSSLGTKARHYPSFDEDVVALAKQKIEIDYCRLEAEHIFLDRLVEMSREEKVDTLFELFDLDGSGQLDTKEMYKSLKNLKEGEVGMLANQIEATFDEFIEDYNGCLTRPQFIELMQCLQDDLACNFEELAQLLVMKICFKETGQSILEIAIEELAFAEQEPLSETNSNGQRTAASVQSFDTALMQARLILIFDMLNPNGQRDVDYKEVVKHLFRFAEGMGEVKRDVLLSFNEGRRLDFFAFCELILDVCICFPPNVDFHDVCNAMTLSVARRDVTEEDVKRFFHHVNAAEQIALSKRSLIQEDPEVTGRLCRLFDLIDLDKNGSIDVEELAIGLDKFRDAKTVNNLDNGKVLGNFDQDSDQLLDRTEFASMVNGFATAAQIDVHQLIDFLVVQAALRDADTAEEAYMTSLKKVSSKRANSGSSWLQPRVSQSKRRGSLVGNVWESATTALNLQPGRKRFSLANGLRSRSPSPVGDPF